MQFGFGFKSELFAQLTKFFISNACLKNLQVIWKMDCRTWRWENLLRLGEIWAWFYSIFQLWQSTKLILPTAVLFGSLWKPNRYYGSHNAFFHVFVSVFSVKLPGKLLYLW
jgi:hypothetical protein